VRSRDEVLARREEQRRLALEHRAAKRYVEAAACALMVSALSWVLGKTGEPTHRVKLDR
jgi:hypothetical protein